MLCVIAGGYGYVLDTRKPEQWAKIEQRPVVELKPLPDHQLILFTGFTSITALGTNGIAWTTKRLSWEGIRVSEIRQARVFGFGWDAVTDKEFPFEVDLKTGEHTGGAAP